MKRSFKNDGGVATMEAPVVQTAEDIAKEKAAKQRAANAKAIQKKKDKLAAMIFHPSFKAEMKVNKDGIDELTPTVKLAEVPTDFNFDTHKPIEPQHLTTRAAYYEYTAKMYEHRAAEARKKAADIRSGVKPEPTAKKFDMLQKRFDDLASLLGPELAKDGIDMDKLREKIAQMAKEAAEKANGNGAPVVQTPA